MVLAVGCGDSNGGGGGGNIVVATNVIAEGTLEYDSYEGLPPNFTGLRFIVTYSDGSVRTFYNADEFTVDPPFVAPLTTGNGVFERLQNEFRVGLDRANPAIVTIPLNRVHQLDREFLGFINIAPEDPMDVRPDVRLRNSPGFNIYGIDRMREWYYVDDVPDFRGLDVQLVWEDGHHDRFPLVEALAWGAVRGFIQPAYDGPFLPDGNRATGTGRLIVTFAAHPNFQFGREHGTEGQRQVFCNTYYPDSGLAVALPLERVYHVHGLDFDGPAPAFDPIFYWGINDGGTDIDGNEKPGVSWLSRARAAGTQIGVTYSNGQRYVRSLDFLLNAPAVWRHEFHAVSPGNPVGPDDVLARPFHIIPNTAERLVQNVAQEVVFWYRGHRLPAPITVWNVLTGITVEPVVGTAPVPVDMTPPFPYVEDQWDNDFIVGDISPYWARGFAQRIRVTAHWTMASDTTQTTSVVLTYNHGLTLNSFEPTDTQDREENDAGQIITPSDPATVAFQAANGNVTIPLANSFTMNFGGPESAENPLGDDGSNPDPGTRGWGVSRSGGADRVMPVTIWYSSPRWATTPTAPGMGGALGDFQGSIVAGEGQVYVHEGSRASATIDVAFSNLNSVWLNPE